MSSSEVEEVPASPTKRSSETLPVAKVQGMASVTFAKTPKRFRVCVCETFEFLL